MFSIDECQDVSEIMKAVGTVIQYRMFHGSRRFIKDTCRYVHRSRKFCSTSNNDKTGNKLLQQLQARIRMNGAITVADYMREVLTNPTAGYYMHKDVFGQKGDFTTSPEISQMFGELLGVWCVNEWQQCGSPSQIQVVELGPGRGTLADDMLRVFSQFEIRDAVSVHLVEVSPKLSQMQKEKLSGNSDSSQNDTGVESGNNNAPHYAHCRSKYGPEVYWYRHLPDVPRKFTFFVAHEFFDALPIRKFQKKDGKWLEVLVDVEETYTKTTEDGSPARDHVGLRYVLSSGETPACKLLLPDAIQPSESREHIEVCPDGAVLIQEIANRVEIDGGFALIADYGHTGNKSDTFRAFKNHKLHEPLVDPGCADLTADVDFAYLSKMINNRASVYGPITQEKFLHNMGIGYRLQALLANAGLEQRKSLITGYDMMCNPAKMGERFKFLALSRHRPGNDYQPAGFIALH